MLEIDGITVYTIDEFDEAMDRLETDTVLGFDIETTGLDPWKDGIAVIQLYGRDSNACAVFQTYWTGIPDRLADLLSNPERLLIGHNIANFDLLFLHTHGIPWHQGTWYDTLIGESVLITNNRRGMSKSLAATMERRLGSNQKITTSHGHWTEDLTAEQLEYAARDVLSLPALWAAQQAAAKESNQMAVLDFEQNLLPNVVWMVVNGLPIDEDYLPVYLDEQQTQADLAKSRLFERLGIINLNSPVQIKKAFAAQGVHVTSTMEEVLVDLVQGEDDKAAELAQMLLDFRFPNQRIKLFSKWKEQHIRNGRVHGRYWQTGTDTGRFAGSDPNLQQVPRDARKLVRAPHGYKIVSVDFSQIEIVVCAVIAQDPIMLEILQHGDIHRWVAARLYDIPEDQVTSLQRKHAKACSFTLIFGGSAIGLYAYARGLGAPMTKAQAVEMHARFFEMFPGVANFVSKGYQLAHRDGAVFLRLPRNWRRMLVGSQKTPQRILNNIIQGTAAAGLKTAILVAGERGLVANLLCACVHDELVACVREEHAEDYAAELGRAMVDGMTRIVLGPVRVEVKIGDTW